MVPHHIAVIMDGNNRWAKRRNLPGAAGHRAGVEAIRNILRACNKHKVKVLTLFAFSSENWGRPRAEVRTLLALFSRYLRNETRELHGDGIRIRFIGQRSNFSERLQGLMAYAETLTADNVDTTLVIAADYGGQWDITNAVRGLAEQVERGELKSAEISAEMLDAGTCLADVPKPDLCIRTGGDHRISNFMLWQFAYSELYFTDTLWPDFGEADLELAIEDYGNRERRFGLREQDLQSPVQGVLLDV
ncbi:MAG: polyprenyl diphosphate synthase [Gammaproteobacteria bacterium]|nr:polyprenyl diphosphate synthase [Gammaproteobacteria bacterium]